MPGHEFIGIEELNAIKDVFVENGGYLYRYGRGHYVQDFEDALAKYFDVNYVHCVSSGTAALKLALQSLGVKKGDEVITQAHTFIATVEAIVEIGATPVIVDIDKSLNMSPDALCDAITSKTKVVIPVHMSGVPCSMRQINKSIEQCGNSNIKVLEDNAQSIGAKYRGRYTGTIGDVGILSFDFGKTITTGEGGAVLTNDKATYETVRGLSDHGHAFTNKQRGLDDFIGAGFNYRMNEIQGAIGLAQLGKLDKIISLQRWHKLKLYEGLHKLVETRKIINRNEETAVSFSFFLESEKETNQFVRELKKLNYNTYNLPDALKFHFAGYWNHIDFKSNGLKKSKELLNRTVALPIAARYDVYSDIEKRINDVKRIIKEIKK